MMIRCETENLQCMNKGVLPLPYIAIAVKEQQSIKHIFTISRTKGESKKKESQSKRKERKNIINKQRYTNLPIILCDY